MMKRKTILYWFIGWTGLFVATLYSPVGSPDLYNQKSGYAIVENVSFSNIDLSHANGRVIRGNSNNLDVQPVLDQNTTSGIVMDGSQNITGLSAIGHSAGTGQGASTSKANNAAGGGMVATAAGSATRSSVSSMNSTYQSVTVVAVDLPGAVTRQSATNDNSTATLQPSLDDNDPGQLIPVGDNFAILMLMLGLYVVLRYRRVLGI